MIVSNGPWYVVRVPLSDVDFVAPDFAAAYRTKRGRLNERDFPRHLQLAQWCLRHDLDRFAADQLLHLARLDPHHSAVDALEQQLRRRAAGSGTGRRRRPTGDFRVGCDVRPRAATRHRRPTGPLPYELPSVSPVALAEFTRSIQPLLLNRCGQTTCHGSAGQNAFQLQRLRASGVARKDLTLRNLRSAIAQHRLAGCRPDVAVGACHSAPRPRQPGPLWASRNEAVRTAARLGDPGGSRRARWQRPVAKSPWPRRSGRWSRRNERNPPPTELDVVRLGIRRLHAATPSTRMIRPHSTLASRAIRPTQALSPELPHRMRAVRCRVRLPASAVLAIAVGYVTLSTFWKDD